MVWMIKNRTSDELYEKLTEVCERVEIEGLILGVVCVALQIKGRRAKLRVVGETLHAALYNAAEELSRTPVRKTATGAKG